MLCFVLFASQPETSEEGAPSILQFEQMRRFSDDASAVARTAGSSFRISTGMGKDTETIHIGVEQQISEGSEHVAFWSTDTDGLASIMGSGWPPNINEAVPVHPREHALDLIREWTGLYERRMAELHQASIRLVTRQVEELVDNIIKDLRSDGSVLIPALLEAGIQVSFLETQVELVNEAQAIGDTNILASTVRSMGSTLRRAATTTVGAAVIGGAAAGIAQGAVTPNPPAPVVVVRAMSEQCHAVVYNIENLNVDQLPDASPALRKSE